MSPSGPAWAARVALLCACMFSASGRIHRQSRPAWARWRPSEAVQTTATSVWIILFNPGLAAKRREPEEQAQKWERRGPMGGAGPVGVAPVTSGLRWARPSGCGGPGGRGPGHFGAPMGSPQWAWRARWAWPRASSGEPLLPRWAARTSRSVCTRFPDRAFPWTAVTSGKQSAGSRAWWCPCFGQVLKEKLFEMICDGAEWAEPRLFACGLSAARGHHLCKGSVCRSRSFGNQACHVQVQNMPKRHSREVLVYMGRGAGGKEWFAGENYLWGRFQPCFGAQSVCGASSREGVGP